jgi:hypothetical protein
MMNLLARILSHGFALVVVVLIAITLMYRGDLFPEWELPEFLVIKDTSGTGKDVASATVEHALPKTLAASPEATTGVPLEAPEVAAPPIEASPVEVTGEMVTQDVVSPPKELVPETIDESPDTSPAAEEDELAVPKAMLAEPVVAASPVTVTESEVVTEQSEDPPLADMAPPMPAAEPLTDSQPESADVAAPATVAVTESEVLTEQSDPPLADMAPSIPAAELVTDPQPESVVAAAVSLEGNAGESTYELLAAAREAYWLHDYEGAENHYQRLIQLEPDNPDWYGELGNMYFSQGQWQQATAVYYEAGIRLLNDGKMVQARQMVAVIRGLNGVEADDLENQVNAGQVTP